MAAIKRCRRWIRKKAVSLVDSVVLGDVERFPKEFKNSLEPTHLLFLNLLNPGRLLNRLRQGQVGFLYMLKRSARKSRKGSSVLIRNDPTIERKSRELESTGVSVIPGYFSLDECEKIIDLYSFDSDV